MRYLTIIPTFWLRLLFVVAFLFGATLCCAQSDKVQEGRPGNYRLLHSRDDLVCKSFATFLRVSQSKRGELDLKMIDGRARWSDPAVGIAVDPPYQVSSFDADNDGQVDRVLRVSLSVSNHITQFIFLQRGDAAMQPLPRETEAIKRILASAIRVDVSESTENIRRLRDKYGERWADWLIAGQVATDAITISGRAYFMAWHEGLTGERIAQAYVYEIDREGTPIDKCMFGRICACGGCKGNLALAKALRPARQYCTKQ